MDPPELKLAGLNPSGGSSGEFVYFFQFLKATCIAFLGSCVHPPFSKSVT